jgi:hypothetical protein
MTKRNKFQTPPKIAIENSLHPSSQRNRKTRETLPTRCHIKKSKIFDKNSNQSHNNRNFEQLNSHKITFIHRAILIMTKIVKISLHLSLASSLLSRQRLKLENCENENQTLWSLMKESLFSSLPRKGCLLA